MATVYTRDPAVMKELDTLVNDYPDTYRCTGISDIDKTYEMPKTAVSYRKPRRRHSGGAGAGGRRSIIYPHIRVWG